ncbi:hypothetical protein ACHQM5_001879 [Ranunculus cassubicifolius]
MAEELQYQSRPDTKRKYEDQPPPPSTGPRRPTGFSAPIASISPDSAAPTSYNNVPPPADDFQLAKQRAQEIAARLFNSATTAEAKRPRIENGNSNDDYNEPSGYQSGPPAAPVYGFQGSTGYNQGSSGGYQGSSGGYQGGLGNSKKIDIPNGRVGVIIGKGGETIKYLQTQSGAKIQVQRDMDADPSSPNRSVELTGTPDQISTAERLIKEVLSEAETGGSGLVAKRFTGQPGGEQFSMKVPNNKVGLIIGKGGETIKSMQVRSGARIQLIPLHLPPGDMSTERTVYIDGTQEQIESAKQLVNEVISENRVRNPAMGGGYSQQGFRPQTPNWGQQGPGVQQPGYGYVQPGAYPGAAPQYPPYGGYPPQQPAATGWDQTTAPPSQQTTPGTGYDYYNQQPTPQQPPVAGSSAPADNTGYNNYSQPPASGYSQTPATGYSQPQPSYGGSTYPQQPPPAVQQPSYAQDGYGGWQQPPPAGSQTAYVQPQTGYEWTPVGPPASQDGNYGSQSASTTATTTQAPPPVQPAATQPAYASQPPSTTPSYPPQSGYPPSSQPSGYGSAPTGGYGQTVPPNQAASYGPPQGQKPPPSAQPIYGGHTQQPSSQAGYVQPAPVQPGYNGGPPASSAAPQAGYVQPPYSAPGVAQPGYGAQQQQPYGDSYASGGGYSQQPVYSADTSAANNNNAHGSYDAAPPSAQPSGVPKASPQS